MSIRAMARRAVVLSLALASCARAKPAELAYDGLVAALGAHVEAAGNVDQEFFSVPGRIIIVDGSEVQVFEYADAAARQVDSDQIPADGSSIGTSMVMWIDQPNFWAKGRLIVLYIGREPAVIETLNSVLGDPLTEPWPIQG